VGDGRHRWGLDVIWHSNGRNEVDGGWRSSYRDRFARWVWFKSLVDIQLKLFLYVVVRVLANHNARSKRILLL